MDTVLIIGRVLFALLFINSGITHLTKLQAMVGYATYRKIPAAKFYVIVTGLMILTGGLYVALGIYADLGALLIANGGEETPLQIGIARRDDREPRSTRLGSG